MGINNNFFQIFISDSDQLPPPVLPGIPIGPAPVTWQFLVPRAQIITLNSGIPVRFMPIELNPAVFAHEF